MNSSSNNNNNNNNNSFIILITFKNSYLRRLIFQFIEEFGRIDKDEYERYHRSILNSHSYHSYNINKQTKDEDKKERLIYKKGKEFIPPSKSTPSLFFLNRESTLDMISKYALDWSFIKHYLPSRELIDESKRSSAINYYCLHPNGNLSTLKELLKWSPDFVPFESLLDFMPRFGKMDMILFIESKYPNLLFTPNSLVVASSGGHVNILEYLFRWKKIRNKSTDSVLEASRAGHFEAVKYLLSINRPFQVDAINAACKGGHINIVDCLLGESTKLTKPSWPGIRGAIKNNRVDLLEYLVIHKLYTKSEYGGTTGFEDAAAMGHIEMVQYLAPFVVTFIPGAIQRAAKNGHLEILKYLLDTIQEPVEIGIKTINMVAERGHLPILSFLNDKGYLKNQRNLKTESIDSAAKNGQLETIIYLIENRSLEFSSNAINSAARNGHYKVVEFLLSRSKEKEEYHVINSIDDIATNGHLDIIELIVGNDHCIITGVTTNAMTGAAKNGHLLVVQYLDQHRTEGCTTRALEWSSKNGHLPVVMYLHNSPHKYPCSIKALDWAAENGHLDIVQFLYHNRTERCSVYAIDRAARNGYLDIVSFLMNQKEHCSCDAFDSAALGGHLAVLTYLYHNQKGGKEFSSSHVIPRIAETKQISIIHFIYQHYPHLQFAFPDSSLVLAVFSLLTVSSSYASSSFFQSKELLAVLSNMPSMSAGGGVKCAACTILLTLVEQYSGIHEQSVERAMDEICSFFPDKIQDLCVSLVNTYGDDIITLFDQYKNADDVCHALKDVCTLPTCRLFNNVTATFNGPYSSQPTNIGSSRSIKKVSENPWEWLKGLIKIFSSYHDPIEDIDGDKFSMEPTFRGYNWRGRDCDDFNKAIYPGTIGQDSSDPNVDWNCNGIYGTNQQGQSWEEQLCGNSSAMGVVVCGDSVGAHFAVPPQYLTASQINSTTYKGLMDVLETEFDWPMRGTYTGWQASTTDDIIDSIYLRMRDRNLCNHRDYQNLGVNGARSSSVADGNINSFARDQVNDKPVLFFLELVGNDVCNPHHDYSDMTTNAEFEANILKTLQYLDTQLPAGSHVVFVGLVDGRVLWDTLWNRTHPIGATYEMVYDYLNCLELSPCWGWMNPNETVRNYTSERAASLNSVYSQIIGNYTFKHFDMQYYDFPFDAVNAEWIKGGGHTYQLIANYLMAGYFWEQLLSDHPDWLGQVNPLNYKILQQFGDQGGY
ncbi:Acyloxyacyl hydrolase [Cavenderia fasciculata]|uniref:Acyloxyacyl hydrolase n=1 Tax=Cavenderia fasciculata TaxID=261658 RepID=F4PQU0_CACFS|nr:Acyloxyacyl hydrolase [Cavenderia fasciculata]EGG22048.1 Acyloxyacyl hydrolase [Cavenderia fasciculata]|eukprot:XP_004359899.1 Acyloxyacyl hydrolase [Cavenderia fasciculata]